MRDAVVYWIRTREHTDILSQGYVGVTTGGLGRRKREHLSALRRSIHSNIVLQRAFNKYKESGLIFEVVVKSTEECCYDMERRLRPLKSLGWNCAQGGADSLPRKRSYSEQERRAMSARTKKVWQERPEVYAEGIKRKTGRKATEETKAKQSKAMLEFYKDGCPLNVWERGRANNSNCKLVWLMADEIYEMFASGKGDREISRDLNYPKRNPTIMKMCRLFKSGWLPTNDKEWLRFKNENT